MMSDFWLLHVFAASELRLLIDVLLFSSHIQRGQGQELIKIISQGEFPIYDQYAKRAIDAIQGGIQPSRIRYKEPTNPDSIVKDYVVPFKAQCEMVFGEGCCKERRYDRALWVYGHYFS